MQVKTRRELHWLYYPEGDSVRIINAHNFGGGGGGGGRGSDALGTEIAWWAPSRSGDATDLAGSADLFLSGGAVLTNDGGLSIDLRSDGARAITSTGFDLSPDSSLAGWVKIPADHPVTTESYWLTTRNAADVRTFLIIGYNGTTARIGAHWRSSLTPGPAIDAVSPGVWHHFAAVNDGGVGTIYLDGVAVTATSTVSLISGSTITDNTTLGANQNNAFTNRSNVLTDDIRLFTQAISATDVATLAGI